jgi:enamine deaminase RidA (YjgF/YER057c/UK114 family)
MPFTAHNPGSMFQPVGPYSHGLEVRQPQRWLVSSGTMGLDENARAPDGIEAQCAQAWGNLQALLASAGMDVGNIVKVTTYLADRSYRNAATEARKTALGEHRPAVTTMVAGLLQDDWLVEIEIVAAA